MSLLNKLFKTKDKQQAALPVVTRESPKVAAASREPSPAVMMFRHFQAAMSEEDPLRRKEEIAAITEKYWLARLVREGKYEADRVQALQQLTGQKFYEPCDSYSHCTYECGQAKGVTDEQIKQTCRAIIENIIFGERLVEEARKLLQL